MKRYYILCLKEEYISFFDRFKAGLYKFFSSLLNNDDFSLQQLNEFCLCTDSTKDAILSVVELRNDILEYEDKLVFLNTISSSKVTLLFKKHYIEVECDSFTDFILDIVLQNSRNYVIIDTENQSIDWLYKIKVR